jgi:hypothetical protein
MYPAMVPPLCLVKEGAAVCMLRSIAIECVHQDVGIDRDGVKGHRRIGPRGEGRSGRGRATRAGCSFSRRLRRGLADHSPDVGLAGDSFGACPLGNAWPEPRGQRDGHRVFLHNHCTSFYLESPPLSANA